jgi:hypothetical protein
MSVFTEINELNHFGSWAQYRDVQRTLSQLMEQGFVEKIPVPTTADTPTTEHWYREIESGIVFRCIPPDTNTPGVWESVDPTLL